jgi:hypothetical protein
MLGIRNRRVTPATPGQVTSTASAIPDASAVIIEGGTGLRQRSAASGSSHKSTPSPGGRNSGSSHREADHAVVPMSPVTGIAHAGAGGGESGARGAPLVGSVPRDSAAHGAHAIGVELSVITATEDSLDLPATWNDTRPMPCRGYANNCYCGNCEAMSNILLEALGIAIGALYAAVAESATIPYVASSIGVTTSVASFIVRHHKLEAEFAKQEERYQKILDVHRSAKAKNFNALIKSQDEVKELRRIHNSISWRSRHLNARMVILILTAAAFWLRSFFLESLPASISQSTRNDINISLVVIIPSFAAILSYLCQEYIAKSGGEMAIKQLNELLVTTWMEYGKKANEKDEEQIRTLRIMGDRLEGEIAETERLRRGMVGLTEENTKLNQRIQSLEAVEVISESSGPLPSLTPMSDHLVGSGEGEGSPDFPGAHS